MPHITLAIENLFLDGENPRIGSASSQREALQKIISEQGSKLIVLGTDIVDKGLSPIDRLLVLKDQSSNGGWTVLEGNRRLAVLKILANPAVLSGLEIDSATEKKLSNLAKGFSRESLKSIDCFEVSSREAADEWILLRHTGENGGKGVVAWTGLARERFRGNSPALQALRFVSLHGQLTAEEQELLENFPITTLQRLLETTDVRKHLGFDVQNKKLRTKLPAKEAIKPLRKIVLDLATKETNVSKLKSKESQLEYVRSFKSADAPDLSTANQNARDIEAIENAEFAKAATNRAATKRKPQNLSDRLTLVPRSTKLFNLTPKVEEIFKELRKLKMDEYPHSCAVLLRVFLELSVDAYMLRMNLPTETNPGVDKPLTKKLHETIDHIISAQNCKRNEFSAIIRSLGDKQSPLYTKLLNDYLHNQFEVPKPRNLRIAWDIADPLFKRIWA